MTSWSLEKSSRVRLGLLLPMASNSTAAPSAAFGPAVLVVDGEEGAEAVGGVLLEAGERKVQLVNDGVTKLMAENELVAPHIENVGREVVRRDGPGRTLVADNLGEELGKDVVSLLREGRGPEDPATVQFGGRVVDAFGQFVGDDHLEVVRKRQRLRQAVGHSFEHARVPDLLDRIPVLGLDGVFLVDDRDPPVALGRSGRGVVLAEAGCAREHHEEDR